MEENLRYPGWKVKDVAIALAVVFAGTYGLEFLFGPVLSAAFSTAERYLFFGIVQAFFFVISVLGFVIYRYRGNLKQLGLGRLLSFNQIRKGVLGGFGLFVIVLLSGIVVSTVTSTQPELQPFVQLLVKAKTPFEKSVPFLVGGVLAPVGEEIYFRGFAYPVFKKRLGLIGGIVISAVLFSALHFDLLRFFPLAVGGAGLAWLYETSGSLVTPIVAHSVWNLSMLGLIYLSTFMPA